MTRSRRLSGAILVLSVCAGGTALRAQQAAVDDQPKIALRYSLKSSLLLSRLPDDLTLFPDRGSATGFWRFRFEPFAHLNGQVAFEFALEQRFRALSSAMSTGSGVLPSEAAAPFRIRQLDWRLASSVRTEWRAEVDRAAVHARVNRAELTVGRQAIGWGRGVLFGAIDLFSPFTPLEADREWRRGVDAARVDLKLTNRTSIDGVVAFGDSISRSSFAARLRGYANRADVEIVGGRRARDLFGGLTSSAALGPSELHGELAVFRTPAVPGSSAFAGDRSIVKAVTGGSYRLGLGNGVLAYAEYHYTGFGATSASGMLPLLQDAAFQERYLRGDTQILGRHGVAVLVSYEVSPGTLLSGEWLHGPLDGSGVLVPSVTLTRGDRWSAVLSGYVPYGQEPVGTALGSEFGGAPLALFAQLKMYR